MEVFAQIPEMTDNNEKLIMHLVADKIRYKTMWVLREFEKEDVQVFAQIKADGNLDFSVQCKSKELTNKIQSYLSFTDFALFPKF